jgi:tetratricopeptide (TPR) repeat protein
MRKIFTGILMIAALTAFGQKKKKSNSEKTEPAPTEQTQKPIVATEPAKDTTQQMNPLIAHYLKKYSLASRWNDLAAVKDVLYDLIAETGSDSLAYTLAIYYYENQQYAPAVLISKDLLVRTPKNVDLLQLSASSFEGLGLGEKALPSYESLYLLTDNTAVLYKMAALQYDAKLYAESQANIDILMTKKDIDKLTVTVTGQTNNTKQYALKVALLNLKGLLAQQAGNKVLAKKSYEEALALAPDFSLAKENLAKLK